MDVLKQEEEEFRECFGELLGGESNGGNLLGIWILV